jgi:4-aminobutyrate aminotransferase-like enzyme
MKGNPMTTFDSCIDPHLQRLATQITDHVQNKLNHINGVKPPKKEMKDDYAQFIEKCNQLRGGNLYYPYIGTGQGNGCLVELADRSIKYDMICGIGPLYFGHSHPEIMKISVLSATANSVMHGNLQQNCNTVHLLDKFTALASRNGAPLKHCFLTTTGAMANENALKMLFQKKEGSNRILCFDHCFAGRTMAMSQMTDKAIYREGLPQTLQVDYVPFYDSTHPTNSIETSVQTLKKHLIRYPGKHAGFCMELIQGEGGFYPGTREFFLALIEVLKENKIPLWVDEIQTFARTPEPFAYQWLELDPYVDMVSIGKVSQVCATLFSSELKPKPGLISQTFTGSNTAIDTCIWILDQILDRKISYGSKGLNESIHQKFMGFFSELEIEFGKNFKGPYGVGSMIAFTVFEGNLEKTKKFLNTLFHNGVIAFIAGAKPYRVRFLVPAPILKDRDIESIMTIVKQTMEEVSHE